VSRANARVATATAVAKIALVVLAFVYATQPAIKKPEVYETAVWGLLVLAAFSGIGGALNEGLFPHRRADAALRAVWGASALLFVGGILAAASLYSRTASVVLVDVGLVAYCVMLYRERLAGLRSARFTWRVARHNGLLATLLAVVVFAGVVAYLGGVADPTTNPYDDDIAYLPFVRKLIDTGTLIEPFSFRRLSALGGQTFFLALVSPHAGYRQMNAFDRGICVLLFVGLLLFHKDWRGRRAPLAITALLIGFFLSLPNNSINTAPHFSGFAFFLGLWRSVVFLRREDGLLARTVPIALVATATCTLRQNYLSVPVVMLAVGYGMAALRREGRGSPWKTRLREPAVVAALAVVALLPWFVLAYRSNQSFLFPIQNGTFRRALELKSPTLTFLKEVRFLFSVALENEPIKPLGVLVLAGALVPDEHPLRPLRALWISCAIGLVILSHSFTLSDAGNLARYLYGYFSALAAAVVLTTGTQRFGRGARGGRAELRARAVLGLAVIAMLLQYQFSREKVSKTYQTFVKNVDMQSRRVPPSVDSYPHELFMYGHIQSFLPAGSKVAVMVDEPYWLDYGKNELFNLDMPGYSSLKPDMPYFQGPEKVADYFLAHGIRYVMYVRPEFSHWLYQREFWFARMFNEEEIWRLCAPYFVDLIDSFTSLRETRTTLHEEAGIVILDLATRK